MEEHTIRRLFEKVADASESCALHYEHQAETDDRTEEDFESELNQAIDDGVETIERLRDALVGLIGASTKEELDAMELALRSATAPDSDKSVAINAIDALRLCT